ncbi:MAG: PQQ-like beta-propeller repeat protein [Planctomycetota bacterium]|nr:PQQ-like beta-propeller repeat protein [Planctomycetota bacterium]MDA1213948.1 PQQ-like beta-propeller repeat protein [Planctomycetota bacterium]
MRSTASCRLIRSGQIALGVIALVGLTAFSFSLSPSESSTPGNMPPTPSVHPTSLETETKNTDWPNLFGPTHLGLSSETGLNLDWPAEGPPRRWSKPIGSGYSSPVIGDEHLIVFHRVGDDEVVESFDPETGETDWRFTYPTAYVCRYEYSNGPYSTPAIDDNRVYAWGAEGSLHCLDLDTGEVVWRRSLSEDFSVPENLFAVGTSPLIEGEFLILNVGGKEPNTGIVALDKSSGATVWSATCDAAGYATPIGATIHDRRYLFVFTAEGLVSLDPADGRVWWQIPFKSKVVDTVNASSPVVWNDLVLVTIGPGPGALCVRILPDGSYEEVWRDRRAIDSTFNNLICHDGYVYGFSSRRNHAAGFRAVDIRTGEVMWDWSTDVSRGASLWVDNRCLMIGEYGALAWSTPIRTS